MTLSAEAPQQAGPPPLDPQAIRASLTPSLTVEFDREWESVLETAKRDKDLGPIDTLLSKWRHLAYAELRDPGSYYRALAKAEQIMRTGANPDAGSAADMRALIERRLAS
jgi:hypothetical protein